jgi:hypothetical protein
MLNDVSDVRTEHGKQSPTSRTTYALKAYR